MLAIVPEETPATESRPASPPSAPPGVRVSLPFAWSQTDESLTILMAVTKDSLTKDDVALDVTPDTLSIALSGEEKPRVLGRLFAQVDRFSAVWQVEKQRNGPTLLTVHLDKVSPGRWPLLIRGPTEEGALDGHSRYVLAQFAREEGQGALALGLYREAAEDGHLEAIMTLAAFHLLGEGEIGDIPVTKDPSEAVNLYKQAAALGSTEAMYVLGGLYQQGLELASGESEQPNYPLAVQWFDRVVATPGSKELNQDIYVAGAFQAGLLCMEGGHGLGEPDPAKALVYWRYSIEMGHPPSMYNAAVLFLNGHGVQRDVIRAQRLFKAANAMDPKLVPPTEIASLSQEQLEKLAALDGDLRASGETVPLKELLSRVDEIAILAPQPPKKKKKKTRAKSASNSSGSDVGTIVAGVLVVAGLVGLGIYLVKRFQAPSHDAK